jgi:predicted small secreted protein
MRHFIILSTVLMSCFSAGCNTIGGLGRDLSDTGKALDKAAYWSQNQLEDISEEGTTTSSQDMSNNSGLVVQEPDTLRQY